MDGSALDDPHKGKNPAAVALGKLGGAVAAKAVSDCEEGGDGALVKNLGRALKAG